jgi:hypothetical protein
VESSITVQEIQSPYLTPAQAGSYIHISPSTLAVWRTIKNHPLKFKLCCTRILYTIADLDAFINGCDRRRTVSPNVGRPPGSMKARARKAA